MRLLGLLLILVSTGIFLVQNQQPVILYFLGTNDKTALLSLKLPMGIWVVIFTVAGILTSLIIQIVNQFFQPSSPKTYKSQPRSPRRTSSATPNQRPKPSPVPPSPKRSDWEIPPQPDWEATESLKIEDEDDWKIEEPPKEPTIPSQQPEKPLLEDQGRSFEVPQPPKTMSRQGTVYTYTYRELRDRSQPASGDRQDTPPHPDSRKTQETPSTPNNSTDQIYDANYRIITPSHQDSPDSSTSPDKNEEDEENWI